MILGTKTWFDPYGQNSKKFPFLMLNNLTKFFFREVSGFWENWIFRFFFLLENVDFFWFLWFLAVFRVLYLAGMIFFSNSDCCNGFRGPFWPKTKKNKVKSPKIEKVTAFWRWVCVKKCIFPLKKCEKWFKSQKVSFFFFTRAQKGIVFEPKSLEIV